MKTIKFLITMLAFLTASFSAFAANSSSISPEKKVEDYYKFYVSCVDKMPNKPCYYYKPSKDYVSKKLLDRLYKNTFEQMDYDYFLKAQDVESELFKKTLKIKSVKKINDKQTLVKVYFELFYDSPDSKRNLNVLTEKVGNDWKIIKVSDEKNRE